MSIHIVNLKNYKLNDGEVLIKVDRTTVVGNPYYMQDETERDKVCDEYETYFTNIVTKNKNEDTNFMKYLRKIYSIAKKQDVALGCWCYPKRCHAETIKKFIEEANK